MHRVALIRNCYLRGAMLDRSFIPAISAIHLITVVLACLSGLTLVKVMLNSFSHPSNPGGNVVRTINLMSLSFLGLVLGW